MDPASLHPVRTTKLAIAVMALFPVVCPAGVQAQTEPDAVQYTRLLMTWFDPSDVLDEETCADLARHATRSIPGVGQAEVPAGRAAGSPSIQARDRMSRGELDAARSLLETAYEARDPDPDVPYLLSLVLIQSDAPGERQKAMDLVAEALRRSPGNPDYRLARIRIFRRRTLDDYAERELRRMMGEDPYRAETHAIRGQLCVERITRAGWRVGAWGAPPADERAERDVAIRELATAIALDSTNVTAHYWLAHLYLSDEQWAKAMPVLNRMVGLGIQPGRAHLGRGLAIFNMRFYRQAQRAFDAAVLALPPEIARLVWDPGWAVPMVDGRLPLAQTDSLTAAVFWASKDPLLSDDLDMRRLEQARRFAWVTWFCALHEIHTEGWDTLRGQIYLRYGEPESRSSIQRGAFDRIGGFDAQMAGSQAAAPGGRHAPVPQPFPSEWWRYPDFHIPLGVGFVTGELRFVTQEPPPEGSQRPKPFIDNSRLYALRTQTTPELPGVEGVRAPTRLPAMVYRFPAGGGGWDVVGVLRANGYLTTLLMASGGFQGLPYIHSIALDLETGEKTPNKAPVLVPGTVWAGVPYFSDRFLAIGPALRLSTGHYLISTEIASGSETAWVARDSVEVGESSGLRLSDVVLAQQIDQAEGRSTWPPGAALNRGPLKILPRADGVFLTSEEVYLYLEADGLTKDEVGATDYELFLTVEPEGAGGASGIAAQILEPFRGRGLQGQVTTSWRKSGIASRAGESLRLVIPDPRPSGYRITLRVTDHVSGTSTERVTRLELVRRLPDLPQSEGRPYFQAWSVFM